MPAANFYGKRKPVPDGNISEQNRSKTGRRLPSTAFKPGVSGNPKGKPKGTPNKATVQVREFWESAIDDPEYQEILRGRLKRGELAPAVETMGWHYAKGKPTERVEVSITLERRLDELAATNPERFAELKQRALAAKDILAEIEKP